MVYDRAQHLYVASELLAMFQPFKTFSLLTSKAKLELDNGKNLSYHSTVDPKGKSLQSKSVLKYILEIFLSFAFKDYFLL